MQLLLAGPMQARLGHATITCRANASLSGSCNYNMYGKSDVHGAVVEVCYAIDKSFLLFHLWDNTDLLVSP